MLKFEVENLGKVSKGEIELAPLVMLVGKNNTGKSYVASLIWAFSNLNDLLNAANSPKKPKWFKEIEDWKFDDPLEIEIDENKIQDVIKHVNACFKSVGRDFLGNIFAYSGFEKASIKVQPINLKPFKARLFSREAAAPKRGASMLAIGSDLNKPWVLTRVSSLFGMRRSLIANRAYLELVGTILFGPTWQSFRSSTYIPAARTGLMLAMRALVSQSFDEEAPHTLLPRPLASFLQMLADATTSRGKENSTAEWLAEQVIHGSIQFDDDAVPNFSYVPMGTQMSVPLHASSSMITELAPFLIVAQTRTGVSHIIFEEPEAHLHLEAQRSMARAIARLVSDGVYVTLTTHSDTFVQQINNLITLHKHPNREALMKKFGYDERDLIDPKNAKAYEFAAAKGVTEIKELPLAAQGFIVPSLNETLLSLAEETVILGTNDDD